MERLWATFGKLKKGKSEGERKNEGGEESKTKILLTREIFSKRVWAVKGL